MAEYRKSTIKDVAQKADVSTTTVSLFLNGNESICSAATAERIRAAVAALHYTPNSLSRGLRVSSRRTIGISLEAPASPPAGKEVTFAERLLRGITGAADDAGYAVLRYPRTTRGNANADTFLDGRIDGALVYSEDNDPRPARVAGAGLPVVVLAPPVDSEPAYGAAYADEAETAAIALEHLWDIGHRRIACLTGPIDRAETARLRYDAAISWLARRGACDPLLISPPLAGSGDLNEILTFWFCLPDRPSAIFCVDDEISGRAVMSVQRLGVRIPEELTVIGVNDRGNGAQCDPPLTSVDIPGEAIGAASVQTLLRLIGGAPIDACQVRIPVSQLIVRGSVSARR